MVPVIDGIGVAVIALNLKPAVKSSKLIGKHVCLLEMQYPSPEPGTAF